MNNEETAISILKNALEEANKELAKDLEKMRVMREALEDCCSQILTDTKGIAMETALACRGTASHWQMYMSPAWLIARAILASTAPGSEAGQKEGE